MQKPINQVIYQQKPDSDFPANMNCLQLKQNNITIVENNKSKQELILVKVLYISIDPIMKVWLSGAQTYFPSLKQNDLFHCFAIGQVVQSNDSYYKLGDIVFGNTGFAEFSIISQSRKNQIFKIPKNNDTQLQIQNYLYLINNGMAAYFGIDICTPKKGETVVISTVAGATGLLASQIAKIRNCRVIGITGNMDKIDFIKQNLSIDGVVCYKEKDYYQKLKLLCPQGIDIYFDNVGEFMLDDMLKLINDNGRIALCGAMSTYQDFENRIGLKNYMNIISKRLFIKGFNFMEFASRFNEAFIFYNEQIKIGNIRLYQTLYQGLQSYQNAIRNVFEGKNIGKVIIKVHNDVPKL